MFFLTAVVAGIASAAATTITTVGATEIVAAGAAVALYNLTKDKDQAASHWFSVHHL